MFYSVTHFFVSLSHVDIGAVHHSHALRIHLDSRNAQLAWKVYDGIFDQFGVRLRISGYH